MGVDAQDADVRLLAAAGVPCVAVDAELGGSRSGFVTSENSEGAAAAVRHLHALGHERIATVTGPLSTMPGADRLDGYRAEHERLGLPVRDEYVLEGDFYDESGRAATQRLLALEEPPTAIFAASDLMAAGVLAGAREAGLRVPDDLAVIGFDDISLASLIQPSLTTVRQDMTAIGAATADGLLRMVEDADAPPPHEFVATELVVRGSCGGSGETEGGALRSSFRARRRGGSGVGSFSVSSKEGEVHTKAGRRRTGRRGKFVAIAVVTVGLLAMGGYLASTASGGKRDTITLRVGLFGDFGYHDLYKQYEASHPNVDDQGRHPELRRPPREARASTWPPDAAPTTSRPSRSASSRSSRRSRSTSSTCASTARRSSRTAGCRGSGQQSIAPNGALIGLGTDVGGLAICYRRDLFAKAGLPTDRAAVSKLWPNWRRSSHGQALPGHAPKGVHFFDSG